MSAPRSKSTKELLATAKLPERIVSICIRGDLVAEHQRLEAEMQATVRAEATDGRMTGRKSKALATQVQRLEAEMQDAVLDLRLRALKPQKRNPDDPDESPGWRDLMRKYPPPKGSDELVDVIPFMGEALPLSVVEPDDMDAEDWETLQGNTPASEITRLMNAVWEMNTQAVDIPKSLIAYAVNRRSEPDSK